MSVTDKAVTDVRERPGEKKSPCALKKNHIFLVFFHEASILLPYAN